MSNINTLKGYKLDFTTNTLTINYKFDKAASVYGSDEYNLINSLKKDFPNLKIVVKSGREKKKANKNLNLTYKHIEKYISVFKNSDELMNVYWDVRKMSLSAKSPYNYVTDWFKNQFPNYNTAKDYINSNMVVHPIPSPELKDYIDDNVSEEIGKTYDKLQKSA